MCAKSSHFCANPVTKLVGRRRYRRRSRQCGLGFKLPVADCRTANRSRHIKRPCPCTLIPLRGSGSNIGASDRRAGPSSYPAFRGIKTELSTSGGTSDGRFIAPTGAQVIELGPLNETIHKIDERINIEELDLLTEIYQQILENLLGN